MMLPAIIMYWWWGWYWWWKVTGCEEFPEGNLVNWEDSNWFLNSSRGTVILSSADHHLHLRWSSLLQFDFNEHCSRGTVILSSSLLIIFVTICTLQARMEMMDLETDVCRSRDLSLHLVPYKLKVSSRWLSYSSGFPQVGQNVRELIRHWKWKCRRYFLVMIKCKI